jgi:hypothetical protein
MDNAGNENCGDWVWGFPSDDGSQDGAAVSWQGSWGIDFQGSAADYYEPDYNHPYSSCSESDTRTLTESPTSGVTETASGAQPPNWTATDSNGLGWQDYNTEVNNGGCADADLAGYSVNADMFEGHYENKAGNVGGGYTHAQNQPTWSWSIASDGVVSVTGGSATTVQYERAEGALPYGY